MTETADAQRGGVASVLAEDSRAGSARRLAPGLALAAAIAVVAVVLGHLVPVVGAPVFAIVGGAILASLRPPVVSMQPGLRFAARNVLQASVVVLGLGLSFRQVLVTGARSLPVLFGSLAVALLGAVLLGRALRIERDLRTLIGVGTGICGASAIAATDAVIGAAEADVSYAVATIFTFNVAAVLTFPNLGHLLGLSGRGFGLWAGTAINDLSSVVAAASIFGHGATSSAVVVKLTRTLMIIPISLSIALIRAWRSPVERESAARPISLRRLGRALPMFIGWFLVAVTLSTLGAIPHGWSRPLSEAAQIMITMALASIGLSARPRDVRRAGLRPLLLGALLWFLVAVTSLGLQHVTGVVS